VAWHHLIEDRACSTWGSWEQRGAAPRPAAPARLCDRSRGGGVPCGHARPRPARTAMRPRTRVEFQNAGTTPRPHEFHTHVHTPAQRAERPRDPGGVAAFMSAHSKTPYITPSMDISSGEGVVRGRRVQQFTFALPRLPALGRGWWTARWPGTRKRAANPKPQVGVFFSISCRSFHHPPPRRGCIVRAVEQTNSS